MTSPTDATAPFEAASLAGPTAGSKANANAPDFGEELRRLLRSRLILAHLLAFVYLGLLQSLSWLFPSDPWSRPDQGNPLRMLPPVAECLLGAAALWRKPTWSLQALRVWELIHFLTLVAFYGVLRFEMLAYSAWTFGGAPVLVGLYGAVTLFSFTTIILSYGVLIPNTRRRALMGVAAITFAPFAAVLAAAAVNEEVRSSHLLPLSVQAAANLVFPAAIAVFVAARTRALQRQAFEAERRAERLGQYTLKRKLGEGGMGEVWLAEHGLLKRPCAVKFIRPEMAASAAVAARFAREVQAVTALSHVNTVRVYDYGRADDGSFYFVMEYLDGPTLEQLVRLEGPLPPNRAVHLLRQVCQALAEAHGVGLIHRDLKPGNVIVAQLGGQHDVAKLLDFGLVQDLSTTTDERLTRTGAVLGTPAYMSPEQAAGESSVDARGDIYSLGAVAFFALTGRPPFVKASLGQVLAAHRTETAPRLREVDPKASIALEAVVAKCLQKNPGDRYQSAAELDLAFSLSP